MFFAKKKRMIDVRELQRRGVVRIPREDIVVPTNSDGFVEIGGSSTPSSSPRSSSQPASQSNSSFFGFDNISSDTSSNPSDQFSSSNDGYDKREVDVKITGLDNKIYKLEQRIELLERKLGTGTPSDNSTGVMGW